MSELKDINVQIWEEKSKLQDIIEVGMLKKVKIVRLKPIINFLCIYSVAENKKNARRKLEFIFLWGKQASI